MSILTLDDRSPSVVYSTGWNQAGSKLEFNSTTSWTRVAGSTAKVTFRGTSISVYGTIAAGTPKSVAPTSVYSIDGGIPKMFQATQAARPQYHVLFFESAALPDAVHSLEISHPIVSDPLFLDFFFVSQVPGTPPDIPISPSIPVLPSSASASITLSLPVANSTSVLPSSTPTTSSAPLPSSQTTPDVTSTPISPTSTAPLSTSSPDATASAADSAASLPAVAAATKKSNAGAVVGGVIGGIIVLFLLVFGYIVWRRRRRERMEVDALRFPPTTSWNNGGSGVLASPTGRRSFTPISNNTGASTRNGPPPTQAGGGFSASNAVPYQQPYGATAMYPGGYAREYPQQQMQQRAAPYAPSSTMSYQGSAPPSYGQPPAAASQPQAQAQRQAYALPSQIVGAGAGGSYDRYQDNCQDAYGGVAPSPAPAPNSNANYSYENGPRSRVRLD